MRHGGNIYRAAQELRIPERKLVDFSASVNPLGVSKKVKAEIRKHLKYLFNYPDPDCLRLKQHIARKINLFEHNIICGNGSTELLYLVVKALNPEKVLIPAPTFSEYERAVSLNSLTSGSDQIRFLMLEEKEGFNIDEIKYIETMQDCQMAFLCNPNNPTAQILDKRKVLFIAEQAKAAQCFLVVDEAFMDFVPEESVIREVLTNPYLIVVRSLTKFYALSGLRLGYAAFHRDIIDLILKKVEPWSVNTLAQRSGAAAIKDTFYEKKTFELLKKEKRYIESSLKKLNIFYYPSLINYYLLKTDKANILSKALRNQGVLIRDCSNFRGLDNRFLRISVKTGKENRLLFKMMSSCLNSKA